MSGDKAFKIVSTILTIALVTVVLGSPNTNSILWEIGMTFRRMLRQAVGAYG